MKIIENSELLASFVKKFINSTRDKSDIIGKTLMALMTGTFLLHRPSPNAIHHELVAGDGKAVFYRDIRDMVTERFTLFDDAFAAMQRDSRMAMRKEGVMILDEHFIKHSSDEIEGVATYYSPSEDRYILAISTITMHYHRGNVDYPVDCEIYRRLEELERAGKADDYQKKNEIVRALIRKHFTKKGAPSLFLFDSAFMTKENVLLLKALHVNYISRPKRPWICTYKHKKYSLEELFETIPANEFDEVMIRNPRTGKKRKQIIAVRDVYLPKIGTHRVVFVDCTKDTGEDNDDEAAETRKTASGRKFRLFVTNVLVWDAATILAKYSLRWAIETSYRDMNQNLSLSGCKWRELSAQYFFIALTYLCYLFLTWAKVHGFLARYNSELRTIGQLKQAFCHYSQHQHHEWLKGLEQSKDEQGINSWILERIYASA